MRGRARPSCGRRRDAAILDEVGVRAVLRMEERIRAVERALIAFSAGRVAQPVRQMLARY
jgi:hypothetical protein